MTRTQVLIVIGLGVILVLVLGGGLYLLTRPEPQDSEPTLALATVPPNAQLLTRVPLCQTIVGRALSDRGWSGRASLDPQAAVLEIQLEAAPQAPAEELPAGQIWDAFEAALAGRAQGCSGYLDLVVLVGDFQAKVSVDDLVAWESGAIDDGVLSGRVELTR